MRRVEVIRGEGLERQVWSFTTFDFPKVYLEYFGNEERATKRHKWKSVGAVYHRQNPGRFGDYMTKEPEVPEDVVAEALEKVSALLEFKVWRNR